MLVLSRRKDQVVTIGKDIRVTVLEIRGDKVCLGFDGPKNIAIHRLEIARKLAKFSDKQNSNG